MRIVILISVLAVLIALYPSPLKLLQMERENEDAKTRAYVASLPERK